MKYLISISLVVTADDEEEAAELAQEDIGRRWWSEFEIREVDEEWIQLN